MSHFFSTLTYTFYSLSLYREREQISPSNALMKEVQELNEMKRIYLKENALSIVKLVRIYDQFPQDLQLLSLV